MKQSLLLTSVLLICSTTPCVQALPKSTSKRTKKVEISISPVSNDTTTPFKCSYAIPGGRRASQKMTVRWNGYGFLLLEDNGEEYTRYQPNSAFQNKQFARFLLQKKITIAEVQGSSSSSTSTVTSKTILVRRGVPATF